MKRPRPVPLPRSLVVKKGSKIRERTSGSMPSPPSATSTRTQDGGGSPSWGRAGPAASSRAESRSTPPPGMASLALMQRLSTAWWRSEARPITRGSPGAASSTISTRRSKVSRARRVQSASTAAMSTGAVSPGASRAMPRRRRVRSAPRSAASSMRRAASAALGSSPPRVRRREAYPRTLQRRLLKSWAMPEASVPTASSRRAFCRWSARSVSAVTSSTIPRRCSRPGRRRAETRRRTRLPSLRSASNSRGWVSSPSARAERAAAMPGGSRRAAAPASARTPAGPS